MISGSATEHIHNLVCIQQFCARCEMQPDISVDCERCGKRRHSFYDDPVGDLLFYVCAPRKWCEKVVAIAHNAKGFTRNSFLTEPFFLKWLPKLILNGLKIICMQIQHLTFIDSVSFQPMPLRKLPEAFGLSVTSRYPHFFNIQANLNFVGPIPDMGQFGVDEMGSLKEKNF